MEHAETPPDEYHTVTYHRQNKYFQPDKDAPSIACTLSIPPTMNSDNHGANPPKDGSSNGYFNSSPATPRRANTNPGYMQVGTGSSSEHARRLQAMIDNDSGYGGSSLADGDGGEGTWHPGMSYDRPTPSHTPTQHGEYNPAAEHERKVIASHVHQMLYNQNKNILGRAITETVDTLRKLQDMNSQWPAHYPSVQRADPIPNSAARNDPRPGLHHTQTSLDNHYEPPTSSTGRPVPPTRAGTSLGEHASAAESSSAALKRPVAEPRLIAPQLPGEFPHDFSILKIDLKDGRRTDLMQRMDKKSISELLNGQIQKSVQHLFSLRERIDDTSSKVLVTGDLNAGKSTFCNALLRRKILPEDQQPCTSIFCEVLDCSENADVEEVHAIPIGQHYNRDDESTYQVFDIKALEKIVIDDERWASCKIYIKDIRAVDESLLANGVVDIALIDAPGLNKDSVITTANFAKQEEIDVVVFVVSAANHFTESAKEFVFNAAREKAYMFIVVNGFDVIRDKQRAQGMILKQVQKLSPATFKESAELVHFVSSNAVPTAPPPGDPSGGGSGGSGSASFEDPDENGDDDVDEDAVVKHKDPPSPQDKGKGKEKEKLRDFEDLEQSLRRFVLEKRARSKLAPAKTYLMNLLGDLLNIATFNKDIVQAELDRANKELQELVPQLEEFKKTTDNADRTTDRTIEDTVDAVYLFARDTLNSVISRMAEEDHGVPYPGFLSAYQYAEDLKYAMLETISETVGVCELHARQGTVSGVRAISQLGMDHLGNAFPALNFREDLMFSRKKDQLARQVDIEVEMSDFFDIPSLWERQEKIAGTSMAVTVAGVVGGRLIGGVGWLDGTLGAIKVMGVGNVRKMIIPGLLATGVSYAVASIPNSLPRRLSSKLHAQLAALDYTHSNASRISSEVRRALKFPAENLRIGLKRNVEHLQDEKQKTDKLKQESHVAQKYFINLVTKTGEIKRRVENVDLEAPAPGGL